MANIKFSQFTAETDIANFDDIVGYAGAVNQRITPANLASSLVTLSGGPYLPLAGGTMTGVSGVNVPDDFKFNFGNSQELEIYNDNFNTSYIVHNSALDFRITTTGTGYIKLMNNLVSMIDCAPGDKVVLFYNGVRKIETTNTGVDVIGGITRTDGARVMQEYVWTAGNPVVYTNWTNGVFSNLPFDPTPTIDVTDCNVANYGWVCTNAAGGTAGQEATFTLGAAGAGTWRIKVLANWFDQTANVITEGRLNINGTSYEVIAEAAVESTTDKIYYGEKIVTLAAGDTIQFGMIFSGGGVSPFPSAGTTGNTPNSIYFEKIL